MEINAEFLKDSLNKRYLYYIIIFLALLSFFLPIKQVFLAFLIMLLLFMPTFYNKVIYFLKKEEARNNSLYITLILSSFLAIYKNLESALKHTLRILDENLLTDKLSQAIWLVESKNIPLEQAIYKLKEGIRAIDENFTSVIIMLITALKSKHSFDINLNKAVNFHISAIEKSTLEFVENLLSPVKMIFSFFIIIPILLVIIIPIASFIVSSRSTFLFASLFLFIIPLVSLSFVIYIIKYRPLSLIFSINTSFNKFLVVLLILIIGFSLSFVFFNYFIELFSISAFIAGFIGFMLYKYEIAVMERISKMESEFLPVLNEIGNTMASGIPLESAISLVLSKSFDIPDDVKAMLYNIKKAINLNIPIKSVINSFYKRYKSRIIVDALNLLSQASNISTYHAGMLIQSFSLYMEKMKHIDFNMRELFNDILSSVIISSRYALPLISGVSLAFTLAMILYFNKINSFGIALNLSVSSEPLIKIIFVLYGFEMAIVATIFYSLIKNGISILHFFDNFFKTLYYYSIIFLFSYILSFQLIKILLGGGI